ncbi:MAG: tetratricopeptide repeat protein [Pseudomonadota bacterium]
MKNNGLSTLHSTCFWLVVVMGIALAGIAEGKKDKKGSGSADSLVKSGEQAYLTGNLDKAAEIFKKVVASHPEDHRGYYYSAMVLAQQGKKDEAEKMYREALERKPDLPEAMNNLAVILQEKKSFKEAGKLFKEALKADPNYFEAQFNLGYLYEEWNNPDAAVSAYLAASKIDAKDTDALIAVGDIETARGKLEEAVNAYRKAVKRDSSLIALKLNIAALLTKLGKKQEASTELEALVSKVTIAAGADLTIPFKAARELRLAGKPERTLEILSKFPSDAKETFSLQTETGQCWLAMGKCGKAATAFEQALKLKPDSPEAMLALADSYLCDKKCKKATEYYNKYLGEASKSDERKESVKKKIASCKK